MLRSRVVTVVSAESDSPDLPQIVVDSPDAASAHEASFSSVRRPATPVHGRREQYLYVKGLEDDVEALEDRNVSMYRELQERAADVAKLEERLREADLKARNQNSLMQGMVTKLSEYQVQAKRAQEERDRTIATQAQTIEAQARLLEQYRKQFGSMTLAPTSPLSSKRSNFSGGSTERPASPRDPKLFPAIRPTTAQKVPVRPPTAAQSSSMTPRRPR